MKIRGEDKTVEDELTDILEQLDYLKEDNSFVDSKFVQLQKQIMRRKVARLRVRLFSVLSIASVFLLTFLIYINWYEKMSITESIVFDSTISGIASVNSKVTIEVGGISYDIDAKSAAISHNDKDVSVVTGDGKNVKKITKTETIVLKVPEGHQFEMALSDGTKVWLNSKSVLTYPAKFEKGSRKVKIVGEAYFEVVRDEMSPFIVTLSDNCDIKVLGTSFNVDSYGGEEISKTTLVSGKVRVVFKDSNSEIDLSPSEQLYFEDNKHIIKKVNTESVISWKDKMFVFDNTPLSKIACDMSRCYGIEVIVNDKFKDYKFSGRVSYDRGANYFINVLKMTENINCKLVNRTLYVGVIN